MKLKVYKLFFVLMLISVCSFSQTNSIATKQLFNYTIKPVPTKYGMDFKINVEFKSDSTITFTAPLDYYGVKDYGKYFKNFKGENNTIIKQTDEKHQFIAKPNKEGKIDISYTLSLSNDEMDKYSFAPNISTSHFHLAGSQWILPIGSLEKINNYHIKIVDYPIGWNFYSSESDSPTDMTFESSYEGLIGSGFGGGEQQHKTFYIKGKPVSVFIQGKYNIETDSIIEAVGKIVKLQRDWFQDYSQPYYTVSINSRSNNLAGTSFPNLFVCFVMPEATKLQLLKLLSHEMFHKWLPNKLVIKTDTNESSLKYAWFYEGFTDYFSREILTETGIMTLKEFIQSINTDLYILVNNISANETYTELLKRGKNNKFSGEQKKLYYYKGNLIALKWEAEIKKKHPNSSLKQLLLELIEYADQNNGEISFEHFINKGKEYGLNIRKDFENYIIKGKSVKLYSDTFNNNYTLKLLKMPSFDKGYKVDYKNSILENVDENSNAFKAGLRKGMQFLSSKNSYLFGNTWMPNKPVQVNVEVDTKEKVITFKPEGKMIEVYQFIEQQ